MHLALRGIKPMHNAPGLSLIVQDDEQSFSRLALVVASAAA
jgi:hypothetical protein